MKEPHAQRKLRHVEACLDGPVSYRTRTAGFETIDLAYQALPETDLAEIDTSSSFLGRELRAPLLIGAMTGGAALSARINHNLAVAAQRVGVGLMLGSQRVMLERPAAAAGFRVRSLAPDVPILGNLGVAQLNRGYGPERLVEATDAIEADGLALHANPLQEAVQQGGDTDFRRLVPRLRRLPAEVGRPLVLKEVGHGLAAPLIAELADAGFAAFDVAGAGGTSWARVEALVRWGEIRSEALVEWGIPTVRALREARQAAPRAALIASGGVRSGLDVAKALAMGAQACAVALPLLRPATVSPEAVEAELRRLLWELRVAMHGAGAGDLAALSRVPVVARR